MEAGSVPHCVIDGAFDAELVRAADQSWPGADAPWVRYQTDLERKSALHQWEHIPQSCAELLGQMALLPVERWLGVPGVPDLSLYGAGLHEMGRGGRLAMHLDADRHARLGLSRRINAILFVGDWRPDWGGALVLATNEPPLEILPAFNRLVLFATDDKSLHGVPQPLACPPGVSRRSVALYFWGPAGEATQRPRAEFYDAEGRRVER